MARPFMLRYVNLLVGTFVLVVIAALLAITVLLAQRQQWFAPTYQLHSVIAESELDGLRRGTEVLLLGQQVGEIVKIDYRPEAQTLTVTFEILQRFQDQIFDGSVAYVRRRLAGAGDAYVEIMRGPRRQRRKEDGEEIELVSVGEPAQELERVTQMMESIRQAFEDVRNAMVPAFDQLGATAKNLDQSNRELAVVIGELQGIAPRLNPMIDQAEEVLDSSRETVENLRTESEDLEGTAQKLNDGLDGAQEVIDAVRSHWLLRRYIDQPPTPRDISPSSVGRGGGWH